MRLCSRSHSLCACSRFSPCGERLLLYLCERADIERCLLPCFLWRSRT